VVAIYVPEDFQLDDSREIARIIGGFGFALLVTASDGPPQASHLPFLLDPDQGPKGTLLAHMARANPQWREFRGLAERGDQALVAFQGPHAYISPTWYGPGEAVPTWNYVAVHAYGTPQVIDGAWCTSRKPDSRRPGPWSRPKTPISRACCAASSLSRSRLRAWTPRQS
jgi:transcriptional regulator